MKFNSKCVIKLLSSIFNIFFYKRWLIIQINMDIIEVRKVRNALKGGYCMELAKVTSKGQITIPIEIRKKLGIKEGSKVLFLEEAGRIYLANSSMEALREAQAAFAGEAERLGLQTEEDVVAMVKELRKERTVK